ncbi:6-phosphogluconate dehydrogenase-like protein NAD-binding protein [Sporormia fimetaria CBS 119925]|uniref:6-phosphogluconate dehydrogenase-like protein NAD-binding protein n=1 Tax=Sporormia fimetaria CBS 119925 TaxID=1340428 RepID=A0A6A6V0D7_9PLEO|nr:6-phosphogluconate dehydrogenase-like protein NAD-binding protein [Sporormia fimetaria CBS 119925]
MAPQLAWIGLGNMGRGMCKNLVEKGGLDKPLTLYNRTKRRAIELSDQLGVEKTTVVVTPDDAVKSADIIFMCLGDDAAVTATVNTILDHDVKGKVIVDCSTIHPDTSEALEKHITERGAEFVAMPVFGAPAMADSGNLICVMAGKKSAVEKVKPFTTGVMGRAAIDFSDQPARNATLLKVIGNTFILNMVETLSEGHVLAEKTGLGTENLHRWIELMFPGPYAAYSNRMISGDYYQRDEPLFHVDLARKDAGHALKLAKDHGASLPAVAVGDAHLVKVKEHLGNKGDLPSIYGAVREESGLKFENKS